jgi:hypothetical protein
MIKKAINFLKGVQSLSVRIDDIQQAIGRIELRQLRPLDEIGPNDFEFKVYSQSGEDGIIQFLLSQVDVKDKRFIEFGVENYLESNTRFLALNNYWSGLVIDGSYENISFIKSDPIYWRCNIKADCEFITKENINDIFSRNGMTGEIGLLSIDIDGNDYWVWKAINNVNPSIIVAEYNSFFGCERQVTIPYNPSFVRSTAHYSNIYYGASISALTSLANERGYKLVASNKSGNNIFFVREDLMGTLRELSIGSAYREINFREAHDQRGNLMYTSFSEAKALIGGMKVYDIELDEEVFVSTL